MRIAQSRIRDLPRADRRAVITNAILLARRIHELQRRRQALVAQQEQLRAQLPDWAVEPLRLVGMTGDEREILYCVVTRLEIGRVRLIVREVDERAFITVQPLPSTTW